MNLRSDADTIIKESLAAVLPDAAVKKALAGHMFARGRIVLVAVGKAAWQMARAVRGALRTRARILHRAQRHSRRSARHDRLGSRAP